MIWTTAKHIFSKKRPSKK